MDHLVHRGFDLRDTDRIVGVDHAADSADDFAQEAPAAVDRFAKQTMIGRKNVTRLILLDYSKHRQSTNFDALATREVRKIPETARGDILAQTSWYESETKFGVDVLDSLDCDNGNVPIGIGLRDSFLAETSSRGLAVVVTLNPKPRDRDRRLNVLRYPAILAEGHGKDKACFHKELLCDDQVNLRAYYH